MLEIGLIITGLTEVAKMAGLPSKYLPAFAVMLGLFIGGASAFFAKADTNAIWTAALTGMCAGLVTTGLVRRVDHVANKINNQDEI